MVDLMMLSFLISLLQLLLLELPLLSAAAAAAAAVAGSSSHAACTWNRTADAPHVYWINMEKSVQRRKIMTRHLDEVFGPGKHTRFRALTMDEIYVPHDVATKWFTYAAPWTTKEYGQELPPRSTVKPGDKLWPYRVVVSSLFGRRKTNKLKEIGCTISHLFAIRQAVHDTHHGASPYALIIEDDVQFLFNIDWNALAASAPPKFGILQLFNSNKETLTLRWDDYLAKKKKKGPDFLWVEKWPRQPVAYWSTCAYLINKAVMRPIVDAILTTALGGWMDVKLIAGVARHGFGPAIPRHSPCERFVNNTWTNTPDYKPPCVWSPKGYQADSFIYATTLVRFVSDSVCMPVLTRVVWAPSFPPPPPTHTFPRPTFSTSRRSPTVRRATSPRSTRTTSCPSTKLPSRRCAASSTT